MITNYEMLKMVANELYSVTKDEKNAFRNDCCFFISAAKPFGNTGHDYFVGMSGGDDLQVLALICTAVEQYANKTDRTVEEVLEMITYAVAPEWARDHDIDPFED